MRPDCARHGGWRLTADHGAKFLSRYRASYAADPN